MDRSSKRGKIPQQDWPSIIKRYEAGETLASIARTYDCSPPAISYIVSRSRAREATAEGAVLGESGFREPRLVKGQANDIPTPEASLGGREVGDTSVENVGAERSHPAERLRTEQQQPEPRHAANDAADGPDLRKDIVTREGNGAAERDDRVQHDVLPPGEGNLPRTFGPAAVLPQNGETRRTLHLSLSKTVLTALMYSSKTDPDKTRLVLASAFRFGRQEINKVSNSLFGRAPPNTHRPRTADPSA